MPRHELNDVRASHKEAWALLQEGFRVVLVCKRAPVHDYLGMRVVAARAPAQGWLRPIVNLGPLLRQALGLKADLFVLQNPDTLLLGFLLRLAGKPVVYSCHEDFLRKAEIREGIPKGLRRPVGRAIAACEFALTRMAKASIATQPSVELRYRPYALCVPNAPLTSGPIVEDAALIHSRLPKETLPTLIYAGGITSRRGLLRMLDLVLELNVLRPWKLKLLGRFGTDRDRASAEAHAGWRHVDFLGQVSHSASLAHIRSADVGLALLEDVGGFSETSITKLYEYMLMETPFVASDFPYWRASIADTPAGLFVDGKPAKELAADIDTLFADKPRYARMQVLGRDFIERRFNWTGVSAPLRELVRELLSERAVPVNDERASRHPLS